MERKDSLSGSIKKNGRRSPETRITPRSAMHGVKRTHVTRKMKMKNVGLRTMIKKIIEEAIITKDMITLTDLPKKKMTGTRRVDNGKPP